MFGETLSKDNAVNLRQNVGFVSSSYFDRCFKNESGLDIILSAKFGGFGRQYYIQDGDVKKARDLLKAFHIAQKGTILIICYHKEKNKECFWLDP